MNKIKYIEANNTYWFNLEDFLKAIQVSEYEIRLIKNRFFKHAGKILNYHFCLFITPDNEVYFESTYVWRVISGLSKTKRYDIMNNSIYYKTIEFDLSNIDKNLFELCSYGIIK